MTDEEFQKYGRDYAKHLMDELAPAFEKIKKEAHKYRDSLYPFGIDDLILIDGIYQTASE